MITRYLCWYFDITNTDLISSFVECTDERKYHSHMINTLGPGDAYVYLWIVSSLVQVMAACLCGGKNINWTNADL